jgi:hypothetical protein
MLVARAAVAVLVLSTLACATTPGPPSQPVAMFPPPAALATVETHEAPLPDVPAADVPAEGWTSDPARVPVNPAEPWVADSAWERAFQEAFAGARRTAHVTRALSCVAGELGRFVLEHNAPPPERLQRYMNASCGSSAPAVGYRSLIAPVSGRASDTEVLSHYAGQLGPDLIGGLPADARAVGFWQGRAGGRVLALATYEVAPVELRPFSVVPDARGDVVIEGRLLVDAAYVGGYVNQGRLGVASCLVDPSVARPAFRVTCRLAADDPAAWVEIVFAAPRTVLALPVARILLRRSVAEPLRFPAPSAAPARPVESPAAFRDAVVEGLNAARAEGKLKPVRLAAAQSEIAGRVARQYFSSMLGGGVTEDVNTIALGLLAGWRVQGEIRDGTFFSALLPATRDASRWLELALDLPTGRFALLRPDVEEIALGPLLPGKAGLGAIVAGYTFQHGDDHSRDVAEVLRRFTEARAKRGLSAPRLFPGRFEGTIDEALQDMKRGELNAEQALQASLMAAVRRYERSMRGLVYETISIDALEIPPAILFQPNLELAIGVAHHKPPGAAWSQLVIIVVYVDSGAFVNI